MVLMVVVITGASDRQWRRLTALSRCEEPHRIDLTAIRSRRIRTTGDVMRLHVVVDERDALSDRDHELPWFGASW